MTIFCHREARMTIFGHREILRLDLGSVAAGCTPSFREIWAIYADFCEKLKNFPKNFIIFTHFSNERNLSIAKGRSPIRARVRTQAGEIKTSESRHASIR